MDRKNYLRIIDVETAFWKKPWFFYLISFVILFIYFSPYLIWGQDCLIEINDNLDGNIPYFKIFGDNIHRLGWNNEVVPQVMNGLPKSSFLSQWNVVILLFYLFPPFVAYTIHLILISCIAFSGMVLLLKYLWPDNNLKEQAISILGVSLCFALLDYYPSAGISIAGQPLLFYAFLRINNGNYSLWNYLIIFLFPFYSSLVFAGVFIFMILGVWGLYKLLINRKHIVAFISAGLILLITYSFTEQALLLNYFGNSGVETVVEHQTIISESLDNTIKELIQLLTLGLPSHANVFMFPIVLIVLVISLILSFIKKNASASSLHFYTFITLVFALISALYHWSILDPLKLRFFFIESFDFSRFSFFLPTLFYLLFFFSLILIRELFPKTTVMVGLIILLQVGLIMKRNSNNRTLTYAVEKLIMKKKLTDQQLTFRQYYSEELFKKIKVHIGKEPSSFRVITLGIEPAIMHFNGFYTLDGYNSNYPVAYLKSFRTIIEREIEKSEAIRRDFDVEGSICYLQSAELLRGRKYTKLNPAEVSNLEINTGQIKKMGGKYIISAVRINNAAQLGLKLEKTFEDNESLYIIYLYEIS